MLLIGRAECYLVGHADPLKASIRRLEAYAQAGADVLYAPGPRTRQEIAAIVGSVAPKPVNILIGALGAHRCGPCRHGRAPNQRRLRLARAAWGGFMRAAEEIAGRGSFDDFAGNSRSPTSTTSSETILTRSS